jgi:hypothetical protein
MEVRANLVYYKYKCEDSPAITLVESSREGGIILRDVPIACKSDNIYTAISNLKEFTKTLPLEEKLWLFFRLLDLMNYELSPTPYVELYHLITYYLS